LKYLSNMNKKIENLREDYELHVAKSPKKRKKRGSTTKLQVNVRKEQED